MEENDLQPFGVEFLEPLEKQVRGGDDMSGADCCTTFMSDLSSGSDVGSFYCTDVDSCVPPA